MTVIAACGSGNPHSPSASGPTTTLIATDRWNPPTVIGPASTSKFCTLLVADYQHLATASRAASVAVSKDIVNDVVAFTPSVVTAAPPAIAVAARLYLPAIAHFLAEFSAAGLNAEHLPAGALNGLLASKQLQHAQAQVIEFSAQYCHYNIGI